MDIQEEIRINDQQPCVSHDTEIGEFFDGIISECGGSPRYVPYILLSQAYTYGVSRGKRAERARRKRNK